MYQQVIIAAHAPPGFFERLAAVPFFNHTYNNAYVDLLNDFGENILVQIYGHEHTDSFKLFLGPQGMSARGISKLKHYLNFNCIMKGKGFSTSVILSRFGVSGEVESVALLAPSVTPWQASPVFGGTAINPSLRLYYYTPTAIVDYFQYHLNLSKVITTPDSPLILTGESIPEEVVPKWELFYKARETYGLTSLDNLNMASLYDRLVGDDALFQRYYFINSAGYNNGLCDVNCKKNHLCAIAYLKAEAVFSCKESNLTKSHILSHEYLAKFGIDPEKDFPSSSVSELIITLVVMSMALTLVLAVILALMLFMIVVKRSRMVPAEASFPILDLAKNNKQNYRKLP